MKRYLVFGGPNYYPQGGWSDLIGSYDLLSEAELAGDDVKYDWFQIIDTTTGEAIW